MGMYVKYKYLQELAEKYNLSLTDVRELKFSEKCNSSEELEEVIIARINKRREAQRILQRFEEELDVRVKTLTEARKSLKDLGLNFGNSIYDLDDILDVIKWSREFNYEWLLNSKDPFTYNGITYKRFKNFLTHHRMIKATLFKNIVKYKGDLRLAIINSEDDPEFATRIPFSAGGFKFKSIAEAAESLDFNAQTFRALLREGKSQEEAYEFCMSTMRLEVGSECGFPILFRGEVCNNRRELADASGINRPYLYRYIETLGLSELVYRLENDIILNDEVREVINFAKKFNMTEEQVRQAKKSSTLSLEELEKKLNSEKLYYNDKLYYSTAQVEDIEGLNRHQIGRAWLQAQREGEDVEGRSVAFKEALKTKSQTKLKTSSIFT